MRNTLLLLSILIQPLINSSAQDNKEICLKAGHPIKEFLTDEERYRYKEFQTGKIHFRDNTESSTARFNYDLVNGLVFVIQNNDTLPIRNEAVAYFTIGDRKFNNLPQDVVEVISPPGIIELGINTKYAVVRRERVSSNGYVKEYDPTGGPTSTGLALLDVVVRRSSTYYITVGGKEKSIPAKLSKVLKTFSLKRKEIDEYVTDNKIDFNNKENLLGLVAFLNKIYNKT